MSGVTQPTNSVNVNDDEYGRYVALSIAHNVATPPNTHSVISCGFVML